MDALRRQAKAFKRMLGQPWLACVRGHDTVESLCAPIIISEIFVDPHGGQESEAQRHEEWGFAQILIGAVLILVSLIPGGGPRPARRVQVYSSRSVP
jgi:hypothetical protein